MKALLLLLLLCVSALCSLTLPDIDDSALGALLAGDWRSLLPQNLQDTRAQLLKLLTPAPTSAPAHTLSRRPHYRLSAN
jgi:hypothetical protein